MLVVYSNNNKFVVSIFLFFRISLHDLENIDLTNANWEFPNLGETAPKKRDMNRGVIHPVSYFLTSDSSKNRPTYLLKTRGQ